MRLLYDIGIRLYCLLAVLISPWNRKAGLWVRGRRNWRAGLAGAMGEHQKVIWFHCASLGEFEQGRPLIEGMRERLPGRKILLTFFSPSGYEKRKDYKGADYVMYLPLDTRRNARKMLDLLSVEMAIFIKYEFWYHFLKALHGGKVPVYLASGNFRPDQVFFRWYGKWYRRFLDRFTHLFVQTPESEALLRGIGLTQVSVAGDTRFDRVHELRTTSFSHPALEAFTRGPAVVVAGSTWEKDEQLLAHACKGLSQDIRWIIAPHELSDGHLRKLEERFPGSLRYTRLEEGIPGDCRVILVDTIGKLSYLYRYGTIAYIGGGFGSGIHNILEAATYGLPVIFGPAHEKFSEAMELIHLGGAFPVSEGDGLLSTIRQQLENPELLKTTSKIASDFVFMRVGATSAILDKLCKKSGAKLL